MTSAIETFKRIEEKASASEPSARKVREEANGSGGRQGDVYMLRLGPATKDKAKILEYVEALRASAKPRENSLMNLPREIGTMTHVRQVAVGDGIGSRHIAEGSLTVYSAPGGAYALVGPIVVAYEPWMLTHPEHGHFDFSAGCYQTLYQRDYASERAEEIRRVTD